MRTTLPLLALSASLLAAPAFAQNAKPKSGTYNFDPEHSTVAFKYTHNNLSESHGLVRELAGTIVLDAENPANSTVEASFPIANLITVAPALDEHVRSADFFNSPDGSAEVTFKSTKVELDDDGDEAKVSGDLTMNGVTKPVVLDVDFNGAGENPMTKAATIGFNAETDVMRSEFGLDEFIPMVSDEVEIKISVEAGLAQ